MNEMEADLFVEDRAHEALLEALVERLAREETKELTVRIRSARGGHGRALGEFDLYQRTLLAQGHYPHLVVICIDANCHRLNQARREITERIDASIAERSVVACPDPHVERWYMADPDSFHDVVGVRPSPGRRKCERDRYKDMLVKAIRDAGHPSSLGGIEFARELAEGMDLYRASQNERSLKLFVDEARAKIRQL
jgi:hypothetical protein